MLPARWQTPWWIQEVQRNILEVLGHFAHFWPILTYFEGNMPSESDGGTCHQAGAFIQHYTIQQIVIIGRLHWSTKWYNSLLGDEKLTATVFKQRQIQVVGVNSKLNEMI